MKLHLIWLFILSGFYLSRVSAQTPANDPLKVDYNLPDPTPFSSDIRADELKLLLEQLASKEMQGRETGKPGMRKAAEFIADQFRAEGLPPVADRNTYFQNYRLKRDSWKDIALIINGKEFNHREDFYVFSGECTSLPKLVSKEIVFVGYGIEQDHYNDYEKIDVKGKPVLLYTGEPVNKEDKSLITGNNFRSNWSLDWRRKVKLAKSKGATVVFIVDPNYSENQRANRKINAAYGWNPISSDEKEVPQDIINGIFIRPEVAAALLGKKFAKAENILNELREGGKNKALKVKTKFELRMEKEQKILEGANVIGLIEGTDPYAKNEYIFITAHYDHLGMSADSSTIYYGADDDGSGTSAVIEIARAFAEAKKKGVGPRRSVVCMLVSGEEKGLLGSKYYVDLPIFPLKQTVCDINIDMVGRIDDRHANNPNYVYVIGSDKLSMDLHYINERANKTYTKLELDYKFNDPNDPNRYYKRSDHYNFAEQDIPVIFYFNGTHADYHKPTDTVDKINFDALAKRAQLAFFTAWDLANRPSRIYPDKK